MRKKVSWESNTGKLYRDYMEVKSKGAKDFQLKGALQALVRNLFFGGKLDDDGIKSVAADIDFVQQAWTIWFNEMLHKIADNSTPAASVDKRLVEIMVDGCNSVPHSMKYMAAEGSVVLVQHFPFVKDVVWNKVLEGQFPLSARLLSHYGGIGMIGKFASMVMPYDLNMVILLLRHYGRDMVDGIPKMIDNIVRFSRQGLADDMGRLTELLSMLPSKIVSKIGRTCIVGEFYHAALLQSSLGDQKLRAKALRYLVKGQDPIPGLMLQLGAMTVIPEDLTGRDLCNALDFITVHVGNDDMVDKVPTVSEYDTRTIELLLSEDNEDQDYYSRGFKTVNAMLKKRGVLPIVSERDNKAVLAMAA